MAHRRPIDLQPQRGRLRSPKTPLFFVKAPVLSRLAQAQLIVCRQVA